MTPTSFPFACSSVPRTAVAIVFPTPVSVPVIKKTFPMLLSPRGPHHFKSRGDSKRIFEMFVVIIVGPKQKVFADIDILLKIVRADILCPLDQSHHIRKTNLDPLKVDMDVEKSGALKRRLDLFTLGKAAHGKLGIFAERFFFK